MLEPTLIRSLTFPFHPHFDSHLHPCTCPLTHSFTTSSTPTYSLFHSLSYILSSLPPPSSTPTYSLFHSLSYILSPLPPPSSTPTYSLGNGRPFVVQVTQARAWPVDAHITAAMARINAGSGLNTSQDVEIPMLKLCDRTVWEQMQTVAEEKRKAYSCVCWSAQTLTKEKLKVLEQLSVNPLCVDEEGRPSLKIIQKTPLRVLHRRSLLDRTRYIYNIETVLLNDHYFIMNLRTSAGTYVKEFVHGDLGRTTPSVCSLLGCQVGSHHIYPPSPSTTFPPLYFIPLPPPLPSSHLPPPLYHRHICHPLLPSHFS